MIISNLLKNYKYDPQVAFDFSPYTDKLNDITIYCGFAQIQYVNDTSFKVKLMVEHPNLLYMTNDTLGLNIEQDNNYFDLIIDLCPYTCKLLNSMFNTDKYVTSFWPLKALDYIESDRPYPIFYSGHKIDGLEVINIIDNVMYEYLGNTLYNELKHEISHQNIDSYYKKLEIYSKTKICIAHNVLSRNIPNMGAFLNNELYNKYLPWHNTSSNHIPQIKTRMFEGAMMGCILLTYKDNYSITDMYFTENEDFLYYTDEDDLRNKINMILNDYDKYKYLAENAKRKYYEKYTFKQFIDLIVNEYSKRKSIN